MVARISRDRGDTIIEVLFAITVFSALAVGALAVMNRGTAITQRSLEITRVRQEVDAQAEALRFIHASYAASGANSSYAENWQALKSMVTDGGIALGELDNGACRSAETLQARRAFFVNPRTAKVIPLNDNALIAGSNQRDSFIPDTYARLRWTGSDEAVTSQGIWIQVREARVQNVDELDPDIRYEKGGYMDFYIQSCWDSIGSDVPVTVGTVVRLYDPDAVLSVNGVAP